MEAAIWVPAEILLAIRSTPDTTRQLLSTQHLHPRLATVKLHLPRNFTGAIHAQCAWRRVQAGTPWISLNGASSANVDIYRDGVVIATVPQQRHLYGLHRCPWGQRTLRL